MASLFWPGQPMDYQRIYSDTDAINKAYIDFGNYNYGVVTAAAGYTPDEALLGAGVTNVISRIRNAPGEIIGALSQSPNYATLQAQLEKLTGMTSGSYGNNPRVETLILQGYNDYAAGRYDDTGGTSPP